MVEGYLNALAHPPFKADLSKKEIKENAKLLIKNYGQKGLLERLNKTEKGAIIPQFFIGILRDMQYDRDPHLGDDFLPDTNYYNAVGAIYPTLSREQKDDALRTHLEKFERVNYFRVSHNHTPFIREPELLSDIGIARGLYWPGLHDEEHLWKADKKGYWKKDPTFTEFYKHLIDNKGLFNPKFIKSDFLVAYALLRNDFTSFGEDYVKVANPEFLNRVLNGITGLRFARADDGKKVEQGRKRLFEILPKSTHDKIEQFRQKANWANPNNFEN